MSDRKTPDQSLRFWLELVGVLTGVAGMTMAVFLVGNAISSGRSIWLHVAIGGILALFSGAVFVITQALVRILQRLPDRD